MLSLVAKSKTSPGFTLMELMISIGIFLIITSFLIVNFRQGQYKDELTEGANILETAFREMQTQAITGKTIDCSPNYPQVLAEPPGGWGVNIVAGDGGSTITVFADCLDSEDGNPDHIYNASDLVLRTLTLPQRVKISALTVTSTSSGEENLFNVAGGLNVAFSALTESVWLQGTYNYAKAKIKLVHTILNKETWIEVNAFTGQITAGDITILGL